MSCEYCAENKNKEIDEWDNKELRDDTELEWGQYKGKSYEQIFIQDQKYSRFMAAQKTFSAKVRHFGRWMVKKGYINLEGRTVGEDNKNN